MNATCRRGDAATLAAAIELYKSPEAMRRQLGAHIPGCPGRFSDNRGVFLDERDLALREFLTTECRRQIRNVRHAV